jgi:hypothetical protein
MITSSSTHRVIPLYTLEILKQSDQRIGTYVYIYIYIYIHSTHFIAIAEKMTELEKTKGKGGRKLILNVKETYDDCSQTCGLWLKKYIWTQVKCYVPYSCKDVPSLIRSKCRIHKHERSNKIFANFVGDLLLVRATVWSNQRLYNWYLLLLR